MNKEYEIYRTMSYSPYRQGNRTFQLSNYPYLDIVFNDHCNARCKFCIAHLVHQKEWASFERQAPKIDYAIQRMGVKEVLLLGGEPTINDSIFQYVEYLKRFNLNKICITTNGHRMSKDFKYAEKLLSCGITHLNLSLMSLVPSKQQDISGTKVVITLDHLKKFKEIAQGKCKIRINNNVFKGNHDSVQELVAFYKGVASHCDSVKFSPLLKTDSFSTVNVVTEFNRSHILSDEEYDNLWHEAEEALSQKTIPTVRNKETFGFVEYSMVELPTPAIFNYNQHGKLREKIIKEGKINNLKLLPTGDLSLSWNREERDYFIETSDTKALENQTAI